MADYVDGLGVYGAPLNPSNEPGHDHSGGYFGKPIFSTVGSTTLHGAQGETGVIYPAKFYQIYVENAPGGSTTIDTEPSFPVWIPNCDLADGAYALVGVRLRVNMIATGLGASDTLDLTVHIAKNEYTFSVASPNTTGVQYIGSSSAAERVATVPGAVNNVYLSATATRAAGGAVRGCILNIYEIEFGVFST